MDDLELIWVSLATPVGQVWIGRSEAGVARVHIGSLPGASRAGDAFPAAAPAGAGPAGAQRPDPVLDAARTQLAGYFAGRRRVFDLPLDWSALTEPQQQVLGVLAARSGTARRSATGRWPSAPGCGPAMTSRPGPSGRSWAPIPSR